MRARTIALAISLVLVGGTTESRALFDRDDIPYPLRYEVKGFARFRGWYVTGEKPFREVRSFAARKSESDVLSIDGPHAFHWEKPLNDGTLLEGAYADDGYGRLQMLAFTSGHDDLERARFPFDRPNGVVRMNADDLVIRPDLSKIHGRRSRQIYRPDLQQLRGRVAYRFRGNRIVPEEAPE
jgi:hypothetical protein